MKHRVQYIGLSMTDQYLAEFKKLLALRSEGRPRQWIYMSNSRTELESSSVKIKNHFDEMNYPGDIIVIKGTMFKEQKFHYTNLFLDLKHQATSTSDDDDKPVVRWFCGY